jgi:hypothetical protein
MEHETATLNPGSDKPPAAYVVRGNCGREWRIPAAAVLADYKECISVMDGLDDAEMDAYAKEHFSQDQWWEEQCQSWMFVDTFGVETENSHPLFKTKRALENNRGGRIWLVRTEGGAS